MRQETDIGVSRHLSGMHQHYDKGEGKSYDVKIVFFVHVSILSLSDDVPGKAMKDFAWLLRNILITGVLREQMQSIRILILIKSKQCSGPVKYSDFPWMTMRKDLLMKKR